MLEVVGKNHSLHPDHLRLACLRLASFLRDRIRNETRDAPTSWLAFGGENYTVAHRMLPVDGAFWWVFGAKPLN